MLQKSISRPVRAGEEGKGGGGGGGLEGPENRVTREGEKADD